MHNAFFLDPPGHFKQCFELSIQYFGVNDGWIAS